MSDPVPSLSTQPGKRRMGTLPPAIDLGEAAFQISLELAGIGPTKGISPAHAVVRPSVALSSFAPA